MSHYRWHGTARQWWLRFALGFVITIALTIVLAIVVILL